MSTLYEKLSREILPLVTRPSRYVGSEFGIVVKDHSKVSLSFLLAFPDLYEIGMSHLGLRILYDILNRKDDILAERGVKLLPDILANAGGVVVSYFEWAQNIENQQWEDADVIEKLRNKMRRATEVVLTRRTSLVEGLESYQVAWAEATGSDEPIPRPDLRTAAQVVAIQRCRTAALQRGVWP